ncbi:Transposase InsO and inactivated derivatives [Marininema mesophilum]|uniref:Transposase InsO and inactivated derivatives n=1 Tax=Marininema mesophilum TaxID=1048340 RepID=A0A1H3D532_9BACL|nr:Transposase InsO and inactivated derivatives [Marininema mesophilum]
MAQVSRSGYYKWRKSRLFVTERRVKDARLQEHILAIHMQHPYYGSIRITAALRREGILVNRKRVRRLMRDLGIFSVIRKKRPFFGRKSSVLYPNRLDRQFTAETSLHRLVTDITYVRIGNSFAYLSVIQDLWNNEIVAWSLSKRNDLDLVLDSLDQLHASSSLKGVLIHSDQGFQYTSKTYAHRLEAYGMVGSHSRRGNCFDNASMESFFSHLKSEKIYLERPNTYEAAHQAIQQYITFYNERRFQKKFGDLSPVEYREKIAA